MIILGLDPSEKRTGFALYDTEARLVLGSAVLSLDDALKVVRAGKAHEGGPVRLRPGVPVASWSFVVVERFRSQGVINSDIIRGIEASGMLYEAARSACDSVRWIFRLNVCRALHVSGRGKDSQIIDRACEMHGGSRAEAKGKKAAPGPLYGVAGDAWQALGAVLATLEIDGVRR
mgnify:CR=1 FL=1